MLRSGHLPSFKNILVKVSKSGRSVVMRNSLRMFFLLWMTNFFCLMYINNSEAVIDLPWSTTYNCSDWTEGQPLNCDGLDPCGDWTANGQGEQILADANNPIGGGGNGQRHYYCDGQDCGSGGTLFTFSAPVCEFWMRWYMRYSLGFKWSGGAPHYNKWFYFDPGTGWAFIPEFNSGGQINFFSNASGNHMTGNNDWAQINGGSTGDGKFHCYEVHVNCSTGVGQLWVDGVRKINLTGLNYGTSAGWTTAEVGSNADSPANGGLAYLDFDDIVISTTGYIGPIGNPHSPPSPPQGLTITGQ